MLLDDKDDHHSEQNLEQVKTCASLLDEVIVFVAPPVSGNNEEGATDDGEFWEDVEEDDIDNDMNEANLEQCHPVDTNDKEISNESEREQEQFHRVHNIVTFLSISIA